MYKRQVLKWYFTKYESDLIESVKKYPQFTAPAPYTHLKKLAGEVIGYGCKMGEGWLLTAEMMELIESGYQNVVCTQPFGCLPNHIVGKGMIRTVREVQPQANIVPIDYDPVSYTHLDVYKRQPIFWPGFPGRKTPLIPLPSILSSSSCLCSPPPFYAKKKTLENPGSSSELMQNGS